MRVRQRRYVGVIVDAAEVGLAGARRHELRERMREKFFCLWGFVRSRL